MAEHVGDGDQVGAAPDEGGGEGVAADVGGDVVFVEVGVGGDGSDDVAGAADRQRDCLIFVGEAVIVSAQVDPVAVVHGQGVQGCFPAGLSGRSR
jgi:hypothetical protein